VKNHRRSFLMLTFSFVIDLPTLCDAFLDIVWYLFDVIDVIFQKYPRIIFFGVGGILIKHFCAVS
jgi:hypothetical protein